MLLPLWFAFEALAVGETCPASVDVEARVRTILHLTAEQTLNESFLVERHESGLYVELRGADSNVIGKRTLPGAGSCDELAQAAAVVLSTWLSDVHPDFAGALPAPVEAPEPEPEPEPQPEKPPEPPQPVATRADTKAPHRPAKDARPRTAQPYVWDAALGLGADYTAGELALAGRASVGLLPSASGLGVVALAIVTTSRQQDLGPGNFDWRRWPVGLGPALRLSRSAVLVDVAAGPALAWLHFSGNVFDRNFQPDGAVWGGFLSLRAASAGRRWGLFGSLEGQFYPAESRVYASGVSESQVLPSLGLGAFVGARFSP